MDRIDEAARPRRPGEVLAAERERQGLGPADIAHRLHMSVSQVEALEKDEYDRLPRGPFLRGFVRNYAKCIGLVPEEVLALLAHGGPRDPAPRIVVPSQNIRFDPLSDRIAHPYVKAAGIASVAIAFGFAAMYWWLFVRPGPPAPAPVAAKKVEPVASAPAPALSQPVFVSPQAPVEVAAKPEPKPVVASENGRTLKFRFKGKSWVEVRDARGKVLLTGMNDPGTEAAVSGEPPLRVVVGNATDVRMFFDDREFDLEPHMREAVARVTVE